MKSGKPSEQTPDAIRFPVAGAHGFAQMRTVHIQSQDCRSGKPQLIAPSVLAISTSASLEVAAFDVATARYEDGAN